MKDEERLILAGHISVDHTSLALYRMESGELVLVSSAQVSNDPYDALRPIVRRFIATDRPQLRAACFVVTGKMVENRARHPELPWPVSGPDQAAATGLADVEVVTEAVAQVEGLGDVEDEDLECLHAGPRRGETLLLTAGEGLSMARASAGGALPVALPTDLTPVSKLLSDRNLHCVAEALSKSTFPGRSERGIPADPGPDHPLATRQLERLARHLGRLTAGLSHTEPQPGRMLLGGEVARALIPRHRDAFLEGLSGERGERTPTAGVFLIQREPAVLPGAAMRAARRLEGS